MKKILSIMLVVCMMLSMAVMFAIPAAAVDGIWEVYGSAAEHRDTFDEEEDEYKSIPGYEYTNEGLRTIDPEHEENSPKTGVQTKDMVNIKDGVYMLVRIDNFSYDAGDKWYAFSVSDTKYVDVGSDKKDVDGERVVALIRGGETEMSEVQWRHSNYIWSGRSNMSDKATKFDENGKALLELVITWDGSSYNMTVNGAPIHAAAKSWMNEHFEDGMAYVGINLQNSEKGGVADLTILKYGKTKATATTPMGDDYRDPENKEYLYSIADIADPSEIEEGQPAIFMNASRQDSDSKRTIKTSDNEWRTEENYRHIVATANKTELGFSVKNEVSYDIKDFPVVMVMTKNFCTCDDDCWAFEESSMYVMAGDIIAAADDHKISNIGAACEEPITVGDDNYLYFIADVSEEAKTKDLTGRIHGVRFDALDVNLTTVGRNQFDVCFVAFFRTVEEAEDYVWDFLEIDNPNEEEDDFTDETTEAPVVDTTETETDETTEAPVVDTTAPAEDETTAPAEDETTAPAEDETTAPTEDETTAPAEDETTVPAEDETTVPAENDTTAPAEEETETKAPAQTEKAPTTDDVVAGCLGTVGMGAVAVMVAVVGAGFVTFKKRR